MCFSGAVIPPVSDLATQLTPQFWLQLPHTGPAQSSDATRKKKLRKKIHGQTSYVETLLFGIAFLVTRPAALFLLILITREHALLHVHAFSSF